MSRLAIHDTGEGPALLLLHAFPLDASQWDQQVAALSDRYRCLRPDFWGCGSSPAPPPGATLDDYAAAVLQELDERGIADVAVCGLSMGGYVVFALWRSARQRIRAVVLADTHAAADTADVRDGRLTMIEAVRRHGVEAIVEDMVERALSQSGRDEIHVADPVRGRIRRCTVDGIVAAQEAMASRPDSSPLLASIDVPALLLVGADDTGTSPDDVRAMASAMRHARSEVIECAGHLTNLEQPAQFSQLLGDFLDALRRW